jgi:hypothetical protein
VARVHADGPGQFRERRIFGQAPHAEGVEPGVVQGHGEAIVFRDATGAPAGGGVTDEAEARQGRRPRRHSRARPSFPILVNIGETRSCDPRTPRCRTLGRCPYQRDAARRRRRLVGRAHRTGPLPDLPCRAPTHAGSRTATSLV